MPIDPGALARERSDAGGLGAGAGLNRRSRRTHHPDRAALEKPSPIRRLTAGGTDANERLTTITGVLLLILLAVIGVTILSLRSLLWVHLFVGMLLIGPVALKMTSTGYRFVRYYTANPRYRRKGPPAAPLRMLAPIVVISTVAVLLTGVLLLALGPSSRATLLPLHKLSFIVWLLSTSLHVLGHLPEVAGAVGLGGRTASKFDVLNALGSREHVELSAWQAPDAALAARNERAGRWLSLAAALIGGTVLAIATIPQYGPWLQASKLLHH
jgi:hypothetical protein